MDNTVATLNNINSKLVSTSERKLILKNLAFSANLKKDLDSCKKTRQTYLAIVEIR